ncbi:uncharacterized protein [Palaemon carinicauda]|uniref:uncharacterized protein n=1 Tax=Palaemon carinicauda TaxID=392227 RepID=UPI0035B5D8B5
MEELQRRAIEWQEALKRDGLRVNVDETEAMVSNKDGRDWISIQEIKRLAREEKEWMLDLLRAIWEEEVMPKDLEENIMVSKFKQKCDIIEFGNYKRIKLTEHGLKVLEKVLDVKLRKIVKIEKQQYGFMRGRGIVAAIFIIGQLQKKRLE